MKTISDRIISARKAKKWTQLDLANAIKVNVKNISRWELGQAKPSIEAAADLARALDVSVDYIAGLSGLHEVSALEQLLKSKAQKLSDEQKNALKVILEAL